MRLATNTLEVTSRTPPLSVKDSLAKACHWRFPGLATGRLSLLAQGFAATNGQRAVELRGTAKEEETFDKLHKPLWMKILTMYIYMCICVYYIYIIYMSHTCSSMQIGCHAAVRN